jgi:hypothetical protein
MGVLKSLFDNRSKAEIQAEIDQSIQDFLNKGGTITKIERKKRIPGKLTANGKTSGQVFINVNE